MPALPPVPVLRLNPKAHVVDLLFLTTSEALRRRGWDPESFEVDDLGFPNELSGQDYPIVLRLHGPLDQLAGSWYPEAWHTGAEELEPVTAQEVQAACNSLRKIDQVFLKADDSRDAQGKAVSGFLRARARGEKPTQPTKLAA